jgi:hypothetical protein
MRLFIRESERVENNPPDQPIDGGIPDSPGQVNQAGQIQIRAPSNENSTSTNRGYAVRGSADDLLQRLGPEDDGAAPPGADVARPSPFAEDAAHRLPRRPRYRRLRYTCGDREVPT